MINRRNNKRHKKLLDILRTHELNNQQGPLQSFNQYFHQDVAYQVHKQSLMKTKQKKTQITAAQAHPISLSQLPTKIAMLLPKPV